MFPLAIGGLGTTELLIILAVVILLFGASKLPELARGSGRALRIFKAETKGLMDDDDDDEQPRKPRGELNDADTTDGEILDQDRTRRNDGA
ncbi:MAG: twin-arginine translocase TatA/TatE family subunit [Nocardioides sp.]|nr:twin-arginine translocase TatA/TatE family subunit [Nocardioides sp.]